MIITRINQSSSCHYQQFKMISILVVVLLSGTNSLISHQHLSSDSMVKFQNQHMSAIDVFSGTFVPSKTTLIPSVVKEDATESTSTSELPPVLQEMVDERRNYELNLGKAMDTLRKDYPELLRKKPGK